ncbi:MAG: flagellar hook-associated protein 3 FlgL [Gammaproteobacteria bacterium]|jgi:flagellar hook-associated protein 3 FlgL
MRISDAQRFGLALNNILTLQANTAKYQEQIATGKKVNRPSDDPIAAVQALHISERVASSIQYDRNADFADLHLTQQESAIASANDAMQRIRELTIRGKTTTLSQTDRSFIVDEILQRRDEIESLANSRNSAGEYIFSGSLVDVQAFTTDASGSPVYNGDQTVRDIKISELRSIAEGFTGHEAFMAVRNGNGIYVTDLGVANTGSGQMVDGGVIDQTSYQAHDFRVSFTSPTSFDVIDDSTATAVLSAQPYVGESAINFNGIQISIKGAPAAGDEFLVGPSQNQSVFDTIDRLVSTLESNASSATDIAQFDNDLDRALGDIDQAMDRFREVEAIIGARRNTIESQVEANEDLRLQLSEIKSHLEDADLVEAVSLLAADNNALEAAQAAYVRVQSLSLFNFL